MERLEALLDDFNPFVALRWTRQELRHSAFLRWLLDPSETHGLGPYFLRIFLKRIAHESGNTGTSTPTVFDVDGWDYSKTQVVTEWQSIDILIRDDSARFIAVLENKIDTSEHGEQLQRYRGLVERQFPEYRRLFAYLTVSGDLPSDDSYVRIGHGELADLVAETIRRREDQLGPDVRTFLGHYVEMVRRHILEDSQIQEICRGIYENHRRALEALFEHRPDRALEVSEYLQGLISAHDELVPDHSSKLNIHFIPSTLDFIPRICDGWNRSHRLLLFVLENADNKLGLKLLLGPGDQTIRTKIHEFVSRHPKIFNRATQKYYPKWCTLHVERWVSQKQYTESELEDLKDLIANRFERFVTTKLRDMTEVLQDLSFGESPPNDA